MIRSALALAVLALPLAACDGKNGNGGDGTSISFNSNDGDGNVLGSIDGNSGEMKFDVPGFKGAIKIPKIKLDASDFDLNGVHLYPGSTIEGINVTGGTSNKDDDDGVRVTFAAPAAAATVRDWFQERLTKVGYTLKTDGNGLSGTTEDKKSFNMNLQPNGPDKAKGTIVIGG